MRIFVFISSSGSYPVASHNSASGQSQGQDLRTNTAGGGYASYTLVSGAYR